MIIIIENLANIIIKPMKDQLDKEKIAKNHKNQGNLRILANLINNN